MKVTKLKVKPRWSGGVKFLYMVATFEDGSHAEASAPWVNKRGLWASDSDARDPAEIAAWLRLFADALEKYTQPQAA